MEDYIYFILLIAWVLFAFYRRSQKKAEAARQASSQPDSETGKRPFSLEDLFGEEDEQYEHHEEDIRQQPAPPVYQPESIKVIEYQDDMTDKTISEFEPADIRENIRQAVIYSEILNRPYD